MPASRRPFDSHGLPFDSGPVTSAARAVAEARQKRREYAAGGTAAVNTDSDAGPFAIRTYTGRLVDTRRPDPATIDMRDIAHGLAHIERFCGHCPLRPTVAQHSLAVCLIADELLGPVPVHRAPAILRAALLHDAQEAYGISDVGAPAKRAMRDVGRYDGHDSAYDVIEQDIVLAIYWRWPLLLAGAARYHELIHEADVLAYEYESGWGGWGTARAPEWVSALLGFAAVYRHGTDGGERAFLARAAELGLTA